MSDGYDFYKEIIDNLYDGVYFVDRDRVITYWNKGAERITGYTAQQTIGRACRDNLLNHVTANGVKLCHDDCPLAAVMQDGQIREAEVFVHHANGHRVPIVVRASALRDQHGNIIGAIESFSNNASAMESRGKLKELRKAAYVDPLTSIGNRRFLQGRLSAAISEFRQNETIIGILFMDVDQFKKFNDTYGHNIGDDVLRMVAKSIRYGVRATDTVGRWGGDEFIAILHDVQDLTMLQIPAEKVRTLVQHSRLDINGMHLSVALSVGGTLLKAGDTIESVIERADQLMYQSKQSGGNRLTVG
jgi:diguanylate cyclase (GGDEF)-like protein/PAS domain S-box-containing protein